MTTATAVDQSWVETYKAQLPKAQKRAKSVRRSLWYIIGCGLIVPLIFPLIFLFLRDSDLNEVLGWAILPGMINSLFLIGCFILLGLYKRDLKHAGLRVTLYVVLNLAFGFVNLTGFVSRAAFHVELSEEKSQFSDLFSAFIATPLTVGGVALVLRGRLRAFERGRATAGYLAIERGKVPMLWQTVDAITADALKLGLSKPSFSVWLSRTDKELLPSVCTTSNGRIAEDHLLVPRPFVRLLQTNQERAKAVLAHELSHLYQRDANLWAVTDFFFSAFRRVFVPMMIINLAVLSILSILNQRMPNLGAGLFQLAVILRSQRAAARSRKDSEFLADGFSSHLANKQALIESIQEYTGADSPLHPAKWDRIVVIKSLNA